MGTLFASTLRALVREKSLFIWSLAFPILMATIFMFMFANLDGAMEFDPVPTGVVADEAWGASPFSAVAEALGERGDDQLLDVRRFADGEAAASALVDGEVMGGFSVDEDGEPVLSLAPGLQIGQTTDMDAIDRSILESVVGTYVRDADLMASVARENPGAFADPGRLEAMFSSVDATEEVSLTHAAPKESVRFYYALFAMAALFGAQIAVVAVCWTQPNLSPLGARRALGAIGRTRTLLATLLACWLLSFCCLLIAFLYTWESTSPAARACAWRDWAPHRCSPAPWARRSDRFPSWTWGRRQAFSPGWCACSRCSRGSTASPAWSWPTWSRGNSPCWPR